MLAPLRDAEGTIVLKEADDDTRTATFRLYGSRSLTVAFDEGGPRFDGDVPPVLRRALAPPEIGRWSPWTPTTDEAIRMLMKLSVLKKYGVLIEKKMISPIRTTISAADSGMRARIDLWEPAARPGSIAGGAAACCSPML